MVVASRAAGSPGKRLSLGVGRPRGDNRCADPDRRPAQDLPNRWGTVAAVCGVDLEVHPDEFFGLLGPNGARKSTTIGMLTTRVVPTSGQAYVGGREVTDEAARVRRSIGVVQSQNTLDRQLTVAENLEFHARYISLGRRAATALMRNARRRW